MRYDRENRTFDCEPTLTDTQVLDFCRLGYLILEGVVPDDINQRAIEYLEGRLPANPTYIPEGMTTQDLERIRKANNSTLLLEDWFIEQVALNPQVAGVLRSLLGKNVGLPVVIGHHRVQCPEPPQKWHQDHDCIFGPQVHFIRVFYYPQDTPVELGPTGIEPESHLRPQPWHEGDKGIATAAPAGSLIVHHQSILHRKGESTATGVRHMLKYNYWRTVPPTRDWIIEPDFDFQTAYYGGHQLSRYIAHMFYWLSGKGDEFRLIGGQAWPHVHSRQIARSYGYKNSEGYLPNWTQTWDYEYAD